MGSNTVTLTSIHDLIKQIGSERWQDKEQEAAANYKSNQASSIIVEGKKWSSLCSIQPTC